MNIAIARRQVEFDPKYVNRDSWELAEWRDQKTDHIHQHVGKAGLKFVRRDMHLIRDEVAPDMAMACAQLVHLFGFDPSVVDLRMAKPSLLSQLSDTIITANGYLAEYLEPIQHGEVGDESHVLAASQQLHAFAAGIADFYDFDLNLAHARRLAQLATVR